MGWSISCNTGFIMPIRTTKRLYELRRELRREEGKEPFRVSTEMHPKEEGDGDVPGDDHETSDVEIVDEGEAVDEEHAEEDKKEDEKASEAGEEGNDEDASEAESETPRKRRRVARKEREIYIGIHEYVSDYKGCDGMKTLDFPLQEMAELEKRYGGKFQWFVGLNIC
jgi:hypothetical protein